MIKDKNIEAFLALVRAGLWKKEVRHLLYGNIDFDEVLYLAEEQSVVGLVAAGYEQVVDTKPPQEILLQFVGKALQLEQRNREMNDFIATIIEKMRKADIYGLLVKGSGLAQCYDRPLWRPSGDVDLLLSEENYQKAKQFLLPLCANHKNEERYSLHLGLIIDQWCVELHGTLRTGLSGRIDRVVDVVQRDVFYGGQVRSWNNGNTQVFLPAPDNDVFFVFTHFIKHFYKEGMNLRQICDWCRLLWTYKDSLNHGLLESWIRRAGLMSEWKAFAALAVDYLGMPAEAMPLYDVRGKKDDVRWKKKATRIINHILKGESYSKVRDTWAIAKIFPLNTLKFLPAIFFNVNGLKIKERLFMAK